MRLKAKLDDLATWSFDGAWQINVRSKAYQDVAEKLYLMYMQAKEFGFTTKNE